MSGREQNFDVVVAGGGIYGIMCALEAALRDQSVLLIERRLWGAGTTRNWLRILHGGLRYLQTLDLPRFYESVGERRWFIENFPDYVRPLACVMPLYRTGSHSRAIMKVALTLNDALSGARNRGIPDSHHLPAGRIVSPSECQRMLPFVDGDDLIGGAVWYDALVEQPDQLVSHLLDACRRIGVETRSDTELAGVEIGSGRVVGARLSCSGVDQNVVTSKVINATGHAVPETAADLGFPIANPPSNSWAWNVLFDVPFSGPAAGAIQARTKGAQTFFVVPWRGRALVGTGHAPAPSDAQDGGLPPATLETFVESVAAAAPRLGLTMDRVAEVFAGCLPVESKDPSRLTSRPLVVDHGPSGAEGLASIWGIKFTTSRSVSARLVEKMLGGRASPSYAVLKHDPVDSLSRDIPVK